MGVVVDAELVGDGQQQGVGRGDRLVLAEVLDQLVGLAGVRLAEARAAAVEVADLVPAAGLAAELGTVQVAEDGEDAPADGDPRLTLVAGGLPGVAEPLDLLGLQLVERHAGVLRQQRRAQQVHALLRRPLRGRPGTGAPPDPVAEAGSVRLEPEQAGRVREHRPRVRLGEALPLQLLQVLDGDGFAEPNPRPMFPNPPGLLGIEPQ